MGSLKRKKVETSPNSRFIRIEAIYRAKIKAGEIKAKSVDEEGSEGSEILESYIVIGFDESDSNDEVEG
jgi:hypothetical protein